MLPHPVAVKFADDDRVVELSDGRQLHVPPSVSPMLLAARTKSVRVFD